MKVIYQSVVLAIKFQQISFARPCHFRYFSLPLRVRPLPNHLRLGNGNCKLGTDAGINYENLLTRSDVQEYLQFIINECDKYLDRKIYGNELLTCVSEVKACENNLKNLKTFTTNSDEELNILIKTEEEDYRNNIKYNYMKILALSSPQNKNDKSKGATIYIIPGVGGTEAKLFAEELFEMYMKYVMFKGWRVDYLEKPISEGGGMIKGEINVLGKSTFSWLKHEAGVHRVQRIPITEKSGKMQTSTCKVHVLPLVEDHEIQLKESDLRIETKLSSGPGGQNVQKTETCVRVTHIPTGLSAESQRERYQKLNMGIAIKKLKSLLYEKEQKKQELEESEIKMEQARTVNRSEKIRTYNFLRNRVTDHRINHTAHNVRLFMEGTSALDNLIHILDVSYKRESLLRNIAKILKEKNADEIINKEATGT